MRLDDENSSWKKREQKFSDDEISEEDDDQIDLDEDEDPLLALPIEYREKIRQYIQSEVQAAIETNSIAVEDKRNFIERFINEILRFYSDSKSIIMDVWHSLELEVRGTWPQHSIDDYMDSDNEEDDQEDNEEDDEE